MHSINSINCGVLTLSIILTLAPTLLILTLTLVPTLTLALPCCAPQLHVVAETDYDELGVLGTLLKFKERDS